MGIALLLPMALQGVSPSLSGEELVRFARATVTAQVTGTPAVKVPAFGSAKPVFVTIERHGAILGCRGSVMTHRTTLGDEISDAARSACAHDPRYRPLTRSDVQDFLVTVTVVDHLEAISSVQGLRPADGLVLTSGTRTGIVLPWEGKDPEVRLRWAYQKAGVPLGSAARLEKMTAERWRG